MVSGKKGISCILSFLTTVFIAGFIFMSFAGCSSSNSEQQYELSDPEQSGYRHHG